MTGRSAFPLRGALALALALLLCAGCAPAERSPQASQPAPSPSGSGASHSALPGGAGESAAQPEQVIRGTVEEASMNALTLRGEDGTVYAVDISAAAVEGGAEGLVLGSTVCALCQGTGEKLQALSVTVEAPPSNEFRARQLLEGMTLEEKVGQMFIARCPGEGAAEKAAEYHLGGYILFGVDFRDKSREQVVEEIAGYQAAADLPLFIAVDEEGGTVNRVSLNSALREEPFQSPQALYAQGGLELIASDTREKCRLLKDLGINLNFAPVCDVSTDPGDFMYRRSFGQDGEQTARYVSTVVENMAGTGVGCVLKHFPGYGNNADTHTGIAYDQRGWESFLNSDFLPFQAGMESGAGMVLVSHNIVACMDGEYPASLSAQVHRILRNELGFDGVVVTDDLAMDGVRDFVSDDRAAVLAVQAGNDLLCCTDFERQLPTVVAAVESGEIPEERIDQSVLRILELKLELGIL